MGLLESVTMLSDADRAFVLKLYQEYYGLVQKTIFQIIGPDDAVEDLLNDTFARLIGRIALLRTLNQYKLNSYIALTGKNVAINYLRDRKRQNRHIAWIDDTEVAVAALDYEETLEERIVSQDEFARLKATIQCLPEKLRDVLYYKYFLEMDDSAIARELLIRPDSVRQYLTRARRAVRQLMQEEVDTDGR